MARPRDSSKPMRSCTTVRHLVTRFMPKNKRRNCNDCPAFKNNNWYKIFPWITIHPVVSPSPIRPATSWARVSCKDPLMNKREWRQRTNKKKRSTFYPSILNVTLQNGRNTIYIMLEQFLKTMIPSALFPRRTSLQLGFLCGQVLHLFHYYGLTTTAHYGRKIRHQPEGKVDEIPQAWRTSRIRTRTGKGLCKSVISAPSGTCTLAMLLNLFSRVLLFQKGSTEHRPHTD